MTSDESTRGPVSAETKREALAQILRRKSEGGFASHPLSAGQRAMWFMFQLAPDSPAYNVGFAVRVVSALDPEAARAVFGELASRHPCLRTTFRMFEDEPRQVVHPSLEPGWGITNAAAWSEEELVRRVHEEYARPIDLENGPVLRIHLFRRSETEHVLLVTIHHIACDAWSLGILLREFRELYQARITGAKPQSPAPRHTYADYVQRQAAMLSGPEGARSLGFWRERLAGPLPVLDLPTDKARPPVLRYRGASHRFSIGEELYRGLEKLARAEDTTLYVTLLAAFQTLLMHYSGQEDIPTGSPMAGRNQAEDETVVGYFINPVVLRGNLSGNPSFRDLLHRTRQVTLDALSNQDYPFPLLVRQLHPARDPSRSPIFQVLFNLLKRRALGPLADFLYGSSSDTPIPFGALELKPFHLDQEEGQFDLTLEMVDTDRSLTGVLKYSTDLFEPTTVARMVERFETILRGVARDPGQSLGDLLEMDRPARKAAAAAEKKRTLAVSATFTAGPLEKPLAFWMRELGLPFRIQFAPYHQVFQQILDPASLLRGNQDGINAILLRLEDLSPHKTEGAGGPCALEAEQIERSVRELVLALHSALAGPSGPFLVCVCPASPAAISDPARASFFERMEDLLESGLKEAGGAYLTRYSELADKYPVAGYYDPEGEDLGHIPYTPVFFAALATMLARGIHAVTTPPYKVIAVDCDQTLWKGVVVEDGVSGIEVDPARRALQEFLVAQHNQGMLLTLCSKNNESDVFEVFDRRPEMVLRRDHIAASRINWQPKSENLRSLAQEMKLGLDSFILVDDSPLECAEVEANCPQVLTLELPAESARIPAFLKHVWAFDHLRVTEEDRERPRLYKQESQREQLQKQVLTFQSFLEGLGLEVRFREISPARIPRASQLTFRTNQFNSMAVRRTENEIRRYLQQPGRGGIAVDVRDRFGDYGYVGLMLFAVREKALRAETFLLSCRALGRGVEHRMLNWLGEAALTKGLAVVEIPVVSTPRNQPVRDFLESAGSRYKTAVEGTGESLYSFPASVAASLRFAPESAPPPAAAEGAGKRAAASSETPKRATKTRGNASLLRRIARSLCGPAEILEVVESEAAETGQGLRPRLAADYVAPRTKTEQSIAVVWQKVLRLDKIGVYDSFFDLGGHSLLLPQVISHLRKTFQTEVSMVEMFQYPTVSSLSEHLDSKGKTSFSMEKMQERAAKLRTAMRGQRPAAREKR